MMRFTFAVLLLSLAAPPAWARSYDVSLSRLRETPADEAKYRGVAREMGLVLAPLHIGPARTTGHSGFEFTLRMSSHNIHQTRPYWTDLTLGGVMDLDGGTNAPDTLTTTTIEVRKGLPFGLELGTNLSWLENSETLALGGRLRIGLLEGYQDSYAPDVSVYAAVNRMLGSSELDLTTLAAGATLSYRQSISGVMSVSPFFGFDFILVQAGSSLLADPKYEEALAAGCPDGGAQGDTCPGQWEDPSNPDNLTPACYECPQQWIVFDSLDLDDADNQWSRIRYGLRIETILMAITLQHDVPIGESQRPDQHAISVGLSAHF